MAKRNYPGPTLPRLKDRLSEAEAVSFREDLRSADQEVQSYFRVYYIIGLIGVAAWLISPEVKPLKQLVLGNDGYNILVPIAIACLNAVSTTYLLHKSIEIHEIAQFISYASKASSGFLSWEEWRRSSVSATRVSRPMYFVFLIIVPGLVSTLLLWLSWRIIHTPVKDLAPPDFSANQLEHISVAFHLAGKLIYVAIALHIIPAVLIYFNIRRVPRLWKLIARARNQP